MKTKLLKRPAMKVATRRAPIQSEAFKSRMIQPGQVTNPQGGKPGARVWHSVERQLTEQREDGKLAADLVAKSFIDEAINGSFPHAQSIIERQEGKVAVKVGFDPATKVYIGIPTGDEPGAP